VRLLVFGHNDWWAWQEQGFCGRNAALVRALARRPEIERVAVVDTPRYRSRVRRPQERRGEAVSEVADRIVAVRYAFDLPAPASWHPGRLVNERLAAGRLARAVYAALPAGPPPVVWVADPQAANTAVRFARDLVVFDAIDDWRYLPGVDRRAVGEGYTLLPEVAGLTLAVNRRLLDRLRPRALAEVVPNAIDAEEWRDALAKPAELAGLPRPVAVYLGTLQARVDTGLVAAAAAMTPDITYALVGPIGEGFSLDPHPPNVVVLPTLARSRVPGLLLAADVCIVPHRRDGIVASMDPLKVYEYLAAGRPVVSTLSPPLEALRPFVRVAADPAAFATALRDEIDADGEARRAARRRAVSSETWDARAARVLELVAEARAADPGVAP
jgi:glycosyltransferase involved in cell wall biosynthesis